jgi:hypothetical protein
MVLEIAISLIVGFALGYGVRELALRQSQRAGQRRRRPFWKFPRRYFSVSEIVAVDGYAASREALSVATASVSFEERSAASGLLSLTNPASHKACRSALNRTFRYSGVFLRPRCSTSSHVWQNSSVNSGRRCPNRFSIKISVIKRWNLAMSRLSSIFILEIPKPEFGTFNV